MSVPPWQCCPPPLRSWSRAMPPSCVWPTRASPQTGVYPGRWTAVVIPAGRRAGVSGCRRMASTAGAAPCCFLLTSGRRWALWPVRPPRAPRLQSQRQWGQTSVPSPDLAHWDWANILQLLHSVALCALCSFSVSIATICLNKQSIVVTIRCELFFKWTQTEYWIPFCPFSHFNTYKTISQLCSGG